MTQGATEGGSDAGGDTPPAGSDFRPITTQDDLNKVITERVGREKAKYADYKDLKTKADELDKLKAANQTEAEKADKRITDLEGELNSLRHDSLRRKIANDHGITDADDIDLFLTGTDEDTLAKQAKRLAGRAAEQKKNGSRVPKEGSNAGPNPTGPENENRSFVSGLFGST